MRIISGTHKGRNIVAPAKLPVRPTTDRAKEALFNILAHLTDLEDAATLDLFAGTGNIAYELASRGVASVLAVDQHKACCNFIAETAEKLGLNAIQVRQTDVFGFLETHSETYQLIFADPPYDLPKLRKLPDIIFEKKLLAPHGILIVEHASLQNLNQHPNWQQDRVYGQSVFSFFSQT